MELLAKAKAKGERYECDTCGMVVAVEKECDCESECLVCCEEPMKKVGSKGTATPKKQVAKK